MKWLSVAGGVPPVEASLFHLPALTLAFLGEALLRPEKLRYMDDLLFRHRRQVLFRQLLTVMLALCALPLLIGDHSTSRVFLGLFLSGTLVLLMAVNRFLPGVMVGIIASAATRSSSVGFSKVSRRLTCRRSKPAAKIIYAASACAAAVILAKSLETRGISKSDKEVVSAGSTLKPSPSGSGSTVNDDFPVETERPFAVGHAEEWVTAIIRRLLVEMRAGLDPTSLAAVFSRLEGSVLREAAEVWGMVQLREKAEERAIVNWMNGMLYVEWAKKDSPALASHLSTLRREYRTPGRIHAIFDALAQANPDTAKDALQSLEAAERWEALNGLIDGLAARDPDKALEYALEVQEARTGQAAARAAMRLFHNDPALAAELSAKLAEAGLGSGALECVAREWSAMDIPAAKEWARNHTGSSGEIFLSEVLHARNTTPRLFSSRESPNP